MELKISQENIREETTRKAGLLLIYSIFQVLLKNKLITKAELAKVLEKREFVDDGLQILVNILDKINKKEK